MDAAFWDKEMTYNDGEVIESFVRTLVFRKEEEIINNRNSYYGVGCLHMKDGTVAWEIKKAIEQYQHYQRNNGMRNMCDVSGDGPLELSGIPAPKVIDPILSKVSGYWKPQKEFRIPQRKQKSMEKAMQNKDYEKAWDIVYSSFKKKPLPSGTKTRIEEKVSGTYYVIVEEPYKI
jgi:transketolase